MYKLSGSLQMQFPDPSLQYEISGGTVVKNLPASAGDGRDMVLIPGLGTSPGVGNGNPLQYSYLENFMGRGAWWAIVHGVTHDGALHMYILYTGDSVVKNPAANAGNVGSIPGSERSPGEGNGNPLQYSYLENFMDRKTCWAIARRVAKELDMT